jgi:cystathionine beta-lyase
VSTPILGATEAELRRDRTSVKWLAYEPDVLPLWVAEMDALPCPAVVEAVSAALARGDTGYGSPATPARRGRGSSTRATPWSWPT